MASPGQEDWDGRLVPLNQSFGGAAVIFSLSSAAPLFLVEV